MLPVIALVGRPNVGKSTLFNRLTGTRDALVADQPGLTRDRQYGRARVGSRAFIVVDTGGFEPLPEVGITGAMAAQAETAIAEADAVIFMCDARSGLTPHDQRIAARLRVAGRPLCLAVNKSEGLPPERLAEFHELGLGEPRAISAAHGQGVEALLRQALSGLPEDEDSAELEDEARDAVTVTFAGRPNAGKSTLVNALLGQERMIAFDQPGTTRDAIRVDFSYGGRDFTLVDTAGLRRKGQVFEAVEKFSAIKALQAIEQANVVVLVIDALAGVAQLESHIASYALQAGRALVLAVNKCDAIDAYRRRLLLGELERRFSFARWARVSQVSALRRRGLKPLMQAVSAAHAAAFARLPTPKLTRALIEAVTAQPPPRAGRIRPKPRYAHQGGVNPPVIVIHGNALQHIGDSYRRYLEGFFRERFDLAGTALRVEFRVGRNPWAPGAGED